MADNSDTPQQAHFDRHFNGESDEFPLDAWNILFLDGLEDLLHLFTEDDSIQLRVYRDGEELAVFQTPGLAMWNYRAYRNALNISNRSNRQGISIAYEDGSFNAKSVPSPKKALKFIGSSDCDYFMLFNGQLVTADAPNSPLLTLTIPGEGTMFYEMIETAYSRYFITCHSSESLTKIDVYILDSNLFRQKGESFNVPFCAARVTPLGNHCLVLLGLENLAIVDCLTSDYVVFTYSPFIGELERCAARIVDNSAIVYVSTCEDSICSIFKTTLQLSREKGREEKSEGKRVEAGLTLARLRNSEATTTLAKLRHSILEQMLMEADKEATKKIEDLEAEVASLKERLSEQTGLGSRNRNESLQEEIARLREREDSLVASVDALQTSKDAITTKYEALLRTMGRRVK